MTVVHAQYWQMAQCCSLTDWQASSTQAVNFSNPLTMQDADCVQNNECIYKCPTELPLNTSTPRFTTLLSALSIIHSVYHTCNESQCHGCQQQHTAEWWQVCETCGETAQHGAGTPSHYTTCPHQTDHLKQHIDFYSTVPMHCYIMCQLYHDKNQSHKQSLTFQQTHLWIFGGIICGKITIFYASFSNMLCFFEPESIWVNILWVFSSTNTVQHGTRHDCPKYSKTNAHQIYDAYNPLDQQIW